MRFGAVIWGLIGFAIEGGEGARTGTEEGILAVAQENYGITRKEILDMIKAVPEGTAACILIIEHLWAKSLKQELRDAGGVLVAQGMLTPELLAAAGEELAEVVKFEEKRRPGSRAKATT